MNSKVAVKLNHDAYRDIKEQLNNLADLDDQEVLTRIEELVSVYGVVKAVNKMGEDSYRNEISKVYIVSFRQDIDAQKAISALGATEFGKTSMVLRLH